MMNGRNHKFKFMPITPPIVNARSPTGCWTCRVRRKKCDEFKPACKSCSERQLECHWGPKPDWVDGGEEERRRTNEIKEEVKKNSVRRRLMNRGGLSTASSSSKQSSTAGEALASQTSSSLPTNHPRYLGAPSIPAAVNTDPNSSSSSLTMADTHVQNRADSPTVPTDDRCDFVEDSREDSGEAHSQDCTSFISRLLNSDKQNPSPLRRTGKDCDLLFCRTRDTAALSAYYFQNVLEVQFPLPMQMQTRSQGLQIWLPSLVTRTASLYYLSLSLSVYHMQVAKSHGSCCPSESDFSMEFAGHYTNGIERLRVVLESHNIGSNQNVNVPLKTNIEVLLCICFLLALERCRGGINGWKMHLDAAVSLLPALRTAKLSRNHQTMSNNETEVSILEQAEEFVMGFFVSLDILLCTTGQYKTQLKANHEDLLRSSNVQLVDVMGCDGWVMVGISRISTLRAWKSEMQTLETLSIPELVRRGREIEELLRSRLEKIDQGSKVTSGEKTLLAVISKIYIHSALTYLHVVVSGAFPELREIQEAVGKTIVYLQEVSNSHQRILRALTWPILIVGCMASKDQQSEFLDAVEERERDSPAGLSRSFLNVPVPAGETGTLSHVIRTVKTAWDMRERGQKNCDWSSALESLGFEILLL